MWKHSLGHLVTSQQSQNNMFPWLLALQRGRPGPTYLGTTFNLEAGRAGLSHLTAGWGRLTLRGVDVTHGHQASCQGSEGHHRPQISLTLCHHFCIP